MEHVTDHVAQALAREAQQLKGMPLWEGLLSAFAAEVQVLEDALFGLVAGRAISTAVGSQLDGAGRIVGEARNGADDSVYRQRILARVQLNIGSGEVERIIQIFSLATGATPEVREPGTCELAVVLHGIIADGATPASLLALARAGGLDARLRYSGAADAGTFLLDDASSFASIEPSVVELTGADPMIQVSGTYTGTGEFPIEIDIIATGTSGGGATFQWTADGGGTYSAVLPCTTSPTALQDGLSVAFPAGSYHAGTRYSIVTDQLITSGGKVLAGELTA